RAQEARSTPSRMTSFMIAHFAELDAHNPPQARKYLALDVEGIIRDVATYTPVYPGRVRG
ncbi:hypothetical protein, partial [Mesorhizobium sp. M0013]|uniref:hypothetical protein n=1 Tax=Mesorhizobium sp. M0013 TaxID=2956841 RepID=UPI003338E6F5